MNVKKIVLLSILLVNSACSHTPSASGSSSSSDSAAWDAASTVFKVVAPLALGAGAGVVANNALSGDTVNVAALASSQAASSAAAQMLANNIVETVHGPSNPGSYTPTSSSSEAVGNISGLDLSGGCDAAQAKGTQYLQEMTRNAKARGPAICASAKDLKIAGQIAVKVAEACKNIPEWTQMRDAGLQQIRAAETTISQSCHS